MAVLVKELMSILGQCHPDDEVRIDRGFCNLVEVRSVTALHQQNIVVLKASAYEPEDFEADEAQPDVRL